MERAPVVWAAGDAWPGRRSQYFAEFEPGTSTIWGWLRPPGVPCFNSRLLHEIRAFDAALEDSAASVRLGAALYPVHYYVLGSKSRNVFSWGGDLAFFLASIRAHDRAALTAYMRLCLDNVHARMRSFGSPTLTTVSLVEGAALGGGFECALSSDVIVAEENARLGLPEILFNLFPGMGAYNVLARRIGLPAAEALLLSGETYSAARLHALGVVDVLAKAGHGEAAVKEWITANSKRRTATQAIYRSRQFVHPISRRALDGIGELWVEAALRLECRGLKVMERLARRQAR